MLVSPGLEITVIDESQYVSTAVGTVPFILFASAENKLFNGTVAPYTTKSNAGKLLAVTSQRDLITNFGYPSFKQSSAGTPLHGNELNEYGLMTAYSTLGSCNRAYIVRADIDLDQLIGTAVRPIGDPSNGTFWLDLTETEWGVYEWEADEQEFINRTPIIITAPTSTINISGILTPLDSIGTIGSYAVVASSPNNYLFYKRYDNVWVQVGGTEWQKSYPTAYGTVSSPVFAINSTMVINTISVTFIGTTVSLAASIINSSAIPGVTAGVSGSKLVLYVTADAASDGITADGLVAIVDGVGNPCDVMGLAVGTYASPVVEYGSYVQVPDWRITDDTPRPTGSVWAKTSVLGSGASLEFKMYDGNNDVWTPTTAPIYDDESTAIFAMDPYAGGNGITAGTLFVKQDALSNNTVSYRPYIRSTQGGTKITGTAPTGTIVFNAGDAFVINTTTTGSDTTTDYMITLSGTTPLDFVTSILAANIPEVYAGIEASGAITIGQRQGGTIVLHNVIGNPLSTAGFTSATIGVRLEPITGYLILSNFTPLIYTYSLTQPYTAPSDGTLWFYNSPLDVDIMINETTGWKGYRNVSRDARGYNLVDTDPAGVILSPLAPTSQSDNTALASGDLWINTGDLDNFPVISRWTGNRWQLIDNTDVITQNGVVFADARWDITVDVFGIGNGVDPAAAAFPEISTMLTSDYIDLDCPDHRLYPRGTLLFNLRRSGFNVKHYVADYFNENAFPNEPLPAQRATWVTSSGLQNNGAPYMGAKAQRVMVTKAMKAAIDGSDTIREETFPFNLLVAPGYPELIPNMVLLNNDRKQTSFVIGDTPMHMPAKIIDVTNWSTGAVEGGLTTADPYMGVYYPSCLANDLQGNTIVMPPSHMILRAAIKSDNVSYPWFAFAGTRRGLIDNATDIGYVDAKSGAFVRNGLNQGMRDALYQLNINPLTLLPGVGLVNFGNKTRSGVASALDRVNVARLVNYLRTILAHVGDGFLFEPNDGITRSQIKQVISSALNDLIAKRGVYDYLVICDESNNTNDRIARNELYVDIAIEPMKDVEFIYIPIRLKNPGGIKASGK